MSSKIVSNEKQHGTYIVIRNGARVSDSEYTTKEDAQNEYDHWKRIISKWPDGSKLEIIHINNNNR